MLNKVIVSSISFVSLFFIFQGIVQAGGCCFESITVTREGTAGFTPVLIEGKLLSMKYLMSKEGSKYQSNQIIQALNSQSPNVKCRAAITDEVGHFVIECASSQAGTFPIQLKPLSANDEAGQAASLTVTFAANPIPESMPTATPVPTLTPQPTATPTATPAPTPDLATQEKIAELEAKLAAQEKKISLLEAVIRQLENALSRIFSFSRE